MKINLNLNLEANDSISSAIKYKKKGVVAKALLESFHPAQGGINKLNHIRKYNNELNQNQVNYQNIENKTDEIFKTINNHKFLKSDNLSVTNLERQNYIENISPVKFENKNNYLNNKNFNISDFKSYKTDINKEASKFYTNNTDNIRTFSQNYKNFNDANSFENISKNIFKNISNKHSFNFIGNKSLSSSIKSLGSENNLSYLSKNIVNPENQTKSFSKNQIYKNKTNNYNVIDFPQHLPQHFFHNFNEKKSENIFNFPINYSPTINIHSDDMNSFNFTKEFTNHAENLKRMIISAIKADGGRIYEK